MRVVLSSLVATACSATAPPVTVVGSAEQYELAPQLAVLESGDAMFAVAADHVTIAGPQGTVRASAPSGTRWQDAVAVVTRDHETSWIVGLAGGALYRIAESGRVEPLADRLGALAGDVRAIAGAGRTFAIASEHEVLASADGLHLKRLPGGATKLAAARHRVALAKRDVVEVLDLQRDVATRYPLAALDIQFLDAFGSSRLVVRTARGVLVERGGKLRAIDEGEVDQIAVAGDRVWLRDGRSLFVFDDNRVRSARMPLGDASRIFGSATGDVFVFDGARVRRFRPEAPRLESDWAATVEPVFRKACTPCHLANGDSEIDLTTPALWQAQRSSLFRRVVIERNMPPVDADQQLTEADRAILRDWLAR